MTHSRFEHPRARRLVKQLCSIAVFATGACSLIIDTSPSNERSNASSTASGGAASADFGTGGHQNAGSGAAGDTQGAGSSNEPEAGEGGMPQTSGGAGAGASAGAGGESGDSAGGDAGALGSGGEVGSGGAASGGKGSGGKPSTGGAPATGGKSSGGAAGSAGSGAICEYSGERVTDALFAGWRGTVTTGAGGLSSLEPNGKKAYEEKNCLCSRGRVPAVATGTEAQYANVELAMTSPDFRQLQIKLVGAELGMQLYIRDTNHKPYCHFLTSADVTQAKSGLVLTADEFRKDCWNTDNAVFTPGDDITAVGIQVDSVPERAKNFEFCILELLFQ